MTAIIVSPDRVFLDHLVMSLHGQQQAVMRQCLFLSRKVWVGIVDGEQVCTWGIITPTLLSEQAYLWLSVTKKLGQYTFIFVRRSQIVVQELLKEFPLLVGHVEIGNDKAIRWLKWLGAEFGPFQGNKVPFQIRKRSNG